MLQLEVQFLAEGKWLNLGEDWQSPKSIQLRNLQPTDLVQSLAEQIEIYMQETHQIHLTVGILLKQISSQHQIVLPFYSKVSDHQLQPKDVISILAATKTNYEDNKETAVKEPAHKKIPISILTGFLGAGKTTLLNHLLRVQSNQRIAVIENEFGAIAIDKELLPDDSDQISTAEQIIVMDNGCMCCTVRGDLLGAFKSISDKISQGNEIDAVLIETTGMANPVPIVRTIKNTPFISNRFQMNGVLTLVDSKNILGRLEEIEESMSDEDVENDEAFQQIMFADKIVMSKIDLVPVSVLCQVWERIMSLNDRAPLIGCVNGNLDPRQLFNLNHNAHNDFFDDDKPSTCKDHACDDHSHGTNCGHSDHDHTSSNHNKHVGTFSIIKEMMKVDPLKFSWWMRKMATLRRQDQGILYRAKGIVPFDGMQCEKLVFHAVADVMDKSFVPDTKQLTTSKMVFIGKKLDKEYLSDLFDKVLVPISPFKITPSSAGLETSALSLLKLARKLSPVFYRILLLLDSSADVGNVGMTCCQLYSTIFQNEKESLSVYAELLNEQPNLTIKHDYSSRVVNLHGLVGMPSIKTYWNCMKNVNLDIVSLKGLEFKNANQVEAAGVTILDLFNQNLEEKDKTVSNYVVDFTWRRQTLDQFFADPTAGTTSAIARIQYEIEDEYGDQDWDSIKFKLKFQPVKNREVNENLEQYKLLIQLIGGRSSSQVYMISFHTIHTEYQMHVKVDDHRMPIYETKETFHKYHALMDALNREMKIRMLIRVKPDGSGPLGDLCGCC